MRFTAGEPPRTGRKIEFGNANIFERAHKPPPARLFGQCQSHAVIHGHPVNFIFQAHRCLCWIAQIDLSDNGALKLKYSGLWPIQQNLVNRTLIRTLAHYLASREDQTIFYQSAWLLRAPMKSSVCRFFGTRHN